MSVVEACRILIIDANATFRYALTRHLQSQPDFVVVGEAPSGAAALPHAATLTPDIILLDTELPETNAPRIIRALKRAVPTARIIGFSIVRSRRYEQTCRRAGSDAQLPKDSPPETIFDAIRATGCASGRRGEPRERGEKRMSPDRPAGALDDVRVLDLTTPLGAYCTKLLADLGADVIRVEPPGGDPGRAIGPFVGDIPHPDRGLPFLFLNSNKRSVTLNLETADGQALFRRLVALADIVVESYTPGYLNGLGLGYTELSRINPRVIVTSITPFGHTGPYSGFNATDLVGVAMGGLLRLCGFPGRAPDRPGGDQGYMLAGLHGCNGTLVALWHRDHTGEGQHVDVSMQQAVFLSTGYIVHWAEVHGIDLSRGGHRYNDQPGTFRMLWPCKEGWIVGGVGTREREFLHAVEWMEEWGHHSDLTGEEWKNAEYRRAHWGHVEEVWADFASRHTREDLYAEAQARRMTLMPVYTAEDVERDPQIRARGFFRRVDHPRLGALTYPGPAFRPSLTPLRPPSAPAEPGADNVALFEGELGLSRARLRALRRAGVI